MNGFSQRGSRASYEPIAAGPNGSLSSYETHVGPIKVGDQVTAVTLVSSDVTLRKQAEAALVAREARLLEVQEVASLGFYVFEITKDRWTSSPVLDRVFGIPLDYERTVDSWTNLVHPDERQEMLDYFLKEVVGDKKPFDREYRIVRFGDKQVRWVHGLGRLEFDQDGQPISMLGTIQDITKRKRAEEALQKAHDELEQRVKERTAELATANEQLQCEGEERQLAVRTLEQSERRFRNYFEQGLIGMAVSSVDKRWLEVNDRLCEILGYSRRNCIRRLGPR